MRANEFQIRIQELLGRHYSEVVVEWPIHRNATDSMTHLPSQYYPRTDVAVGPFSTTVGHNENLRENLINAKLLAKLRVLSHKNPNPRCLLAIEVVFSGSSKHILGDMLNASAIGLYGIVIGSPDMMPKIKRNMEYLKKLAELDKLNPLPFQNVLLVSTEEFEQLIT